MGALYGYLLFLKCLPQLEECILVVFKEPVCYLLNAEGVLPLFPDVPPVVFISGEDDVRNREQVCVIGLFSVEVEPCKFELVLTLFDALELREDKAIFPVIRGQYEEESQVSVRKAFRKVSDKRD